MVSMRMAPNPEPVAGFVAVCTALGFQLPDARHGALAAGDL
jgi:hypothetical protein